MNKTIGNASACATFLSHRMVRDKEKAGVGIKNITHETLLGLISMDGKFLFYRQS